MKSDMNRRAMLAFLCSALTGCVGGAGSSVPKTPLKSDASLKEGTKKKKKRRGPRKRTLGIELWAGAEEQAGAPFPTVNTVTGRRRNRFIRGPIAWTDPRSNERILAYERIKQYKIGQKRQILTITHDGQALGRVLDSRPKQADRYFENEAIFPLGVWRRGEKRNFEAIEYTAEGPKLRKITIRIRRLSYTYRGVKRSLRYDWISRDGSGKLLYRERYIYSPGRGLVKFEDLTKRKPKKKKKRKKKSRKKAN